MNTVEKHLAIFWRAFLVVHDGLDEFIIVDVASGVFLVTDKSVDLLLGEFLTEVGEDVSEFS